jgi:CheY-like chemotaxis protein
LSDSDGPLHILIADDEPMLRSVIAEFLGTLGNCTFAEVQDGIEAAEYLRSHRVDCLLSDARMPRMGLEELIEVVVRESPETVIVATSGYSDLETACRMLELGAHEFLAKPLNLDLLEQSLRWIPHRNRILAIAGECFAGGDRDMSLSYAQPFGRLDEALAATPEPFAEAMAHARRTGELAQMLAREGSEGRGNELRLAALLHEIGSSSQQLATVALERPLAGGGAALRPDATGAWGRLLERRCRAGRRATLCGGIWAGWIGRGGRRRLGSRRSGCVHARGDQRRRRADAPTRGPAGLQPQPGAGDAEATARADGAEPARTAAGGVADDQRLLHFAAGRPAEGRVRPQPSAIPSRRDAGRKSGQRHPARRMEARGKADMADLKGKTLFITGASRGIGLAIGKRAARDGANVAVIAKTTEPHPKLPGTIYTAAEEIEEAGGKALAIAVDIRDEAAVRRR